MGSDSNAESIQVTRMHVDAKCERGHGVMQTHKKRQTHMIPQTQTNKILIAVCVLEDAKTHVTAKLPGITEKHLETHKVITSLKHHSKV